MTRGPNMVPNIIIGHLEQFLFSSYCSKRLYFGIAVKFSFQEHARPPRIQVEKNFWLQNFKIWVSSEWKSASEPLFDLQEALGMTSNMAIFAVFRRQNGSKLKLPDPVFPPHLGVPNFFWCFWNIFMAISNGQNRDTPVSPFWSIKVTVVFTTNI